MLQEKSGWLIKVNRKDPAVYDQCEHLIPVYPPSLSLAQ